MFHRISSIIQCPARRKRTRNSHQWMHMPSSTNVQALRGSYRGPHRFRGSNDLDLWRLHPFQACHLLQRACGSSWNAWTQQRLLQDLGWISTWLCPWHLRSVLGVAQHILFVFPSRGDERSAERVGLIRGRKSSDSHDGMVLFEFWYLPYEVDFYLVGGDWKMNFMTFHSVGNVIIPTDELHHFLREVAKNHQPVTHGGHVCRGTTSPAHKSRLMWFRLSTECKYRISWCRIWGPCSSVVRFQRPSSNFTTEGSRFYTVVGFLERALVKTLPWRSRSAPLEGMAIPCICLVVGLCCRRKLRIRSALRGRRTWFHWTMDCRFPDLIVCWLLISGLFSFWDGGITNWTSAFHSKGEKLTENP